MGGNKVFDTVELLEAILLQLPCKDVLLAQRVSRTWQSIIHGSVKLQKALFLISAHEPLHSTKPTISLDGQSSALQEHANTTFLEHRTEKLAHEVAAVGRGYNDIMLNPLLQQLFPSDQAWPYTGCYSSETQALDLQDASLNKILLTQPPVLNIHFYHKTPYARYSGYKDFMEASEIGQSMTIATMQDLLSALQRRWVKIESEEVLFDLAYKRDRSCPTEAMMDE